MLDERRRIAEEESTPAPLKPKGAAPAHPPIRQMKHNDLVFILDLNREYTAVQTKPVDKCGGKFLCQVNVWKSAVKEPQN